MGSGWPLVSTRAPYCPAKFILSISRRGGKFPDHLISRQGSGQIEPECAAWLSVLTADGLWRAVEVERSSPGTQCTDRQNGGLGMHTWTITPRSEEQTSELQAHREHVCRPLREKKIRTSSRMGFR